MDMTDSTLKFPTQGFDWSKWAGPVAGGALALTGLFGNHSGGQDDLSKAISSLSSGAADAHAKAGALDAAGTDTMAPALDWIKKLASGDRQSIQAATMPERRRVIDQYDTAKQSIAEFSPRGGGVAGALSGLNANEASDLATTTAQARQVGLKSAEDVGMQLKQLGITADQLSSQQMAQLIQAYQLQAQNSQSRASGFGAALGKIIAAIAIA